MLGLSRAFGAWRFSGRTGLDRVRFTDVKPPAEVPDGSSRPEPAYGALVSTATGREVVLEAVPGVRYVDRDTDEPMEVTGQPLPLSPSGSRLSSTEENLVGTSHAWRQPDSHANPSTSQPIGR